MRILRFAAEGFGSWCGEVRFDPTRLNVVVGDNEAGKTTLGVGIAAALYGLDDDRRRYPDHLSPVEHYQPWGGTPYAIELEVEAEGKRFTINRHFGRGTVSVFQEGRGDVTEDFRTGKGEYPIGNILVGLGLEQFVRCALWLQPGPQRLGGDDVRPDASLSSWLERQASTVSGDHSATRALGVLRAALAKYAVGESRLTVANQISRLEKSIEERKVVLFDLERRRDQAGLALRELAKERENDRTHAQQEEAIQRRLQIAHARDLRARLASEEEARTKWEALRSERAALADLAPIPADAAQRLAAVRVQRQAAESALDSIARRRADSVDGPRREAEAKLASTGAVAWVAPGHPSEIAKLIGELERASDAVSQTEGRQRELEAKLERMGIRRARLEQLHARFAGLSAEDEALLRHAPASAQAWASDTERERHAADEAAAVLSSIGRERSQRRIGGWLLLAAGIGASAGAVTLALRGQTLLSFVALAGTVSALALGILLLVRAFGHRAHERVAALRGVTEARRKLQALKEQAAERTLALTDLARRLSLAEPEDLLAEHADYLRVTTEGERWEWVVEEVERLREEHRKVRARAHAWAVRAGIAAGEAPAAEWDASSALARVIERANERLDAQSLLERLADAERELNEEEQAQRDRVARAIEAAREVARALGMPEDDLESAASELENRERQLAHRREIDRLLPELENQVMPATERQAREAELGRLRSDADVARALDDAAEPGDPRDRAEAQARLDELSVSRKRTRDRLIELERKVGWLADPKHGERAATLRLEIDELDRERRRAAAFQAAATMAISRLEAVARETHARWSEFVSHRVNELLPRFGPDLRGFEVTDDLGFSVVLSGQRLERDKVEQSLSAGARDQLSLALRLAICEFLSRGGEALPLVFDDPFASSDDRRAAAGVRYLANVVSGAHQVMLLTCHRGRLDALRAADRAWYEAHVHEIHLPASAAVAAASSPPPVPARAREVPAAPPVTPVATAAGVRPAGAPAARAARPAMPSLFAEEAP